MQCPLEHVRCDTKLFSKRTKCLRISDRRKQPLTIAPAKGALTASERVALPCCQDGDARPHLVTKCGGSWEDLQRVLTHISGPWKSSQRRSICIDYYCERMLFASIADWLDRRPVTGRRNAPRALSGPFSWHAARRNGLPNCQGLTHCLFTKGQLCLRNLLCI